MISEQVEKIQRALFTQGFLIGAVDGIWGRRTIASLKAFQEHAGLIADGVFGPKTSRKLFPLNGQTFAGPMLPWMAEAESLSGLKEVPGPGSNPALLQFARELHLDYAGDDIPWCGLFVAHCIAVTLPEEVLPKGPLRARNWARLGDETTPRLGAVMVFSREPKDSGNGHVAFYQGEDDTSYWLLGGNQDQKVGIGRYPKTRFLTARWPRTSPPPGGGRPIIQLESQQDGTIRQIPREQRAQAPLVTARESAIRSTA